MAAAVLKAEFIGVGPLWDEAGREDREDHTPGGRRGAVEPAPERRVDRRFIQTAPAASRSVGNDELGCVAGELNGISSCEARLPCPRFSWSPDLPRQDLVR